MNKILTKRENDMNIYISNAEIIWYYSEILMRITPMFFLAKKTSNSIRIYAYHVSLSSTKSEGRRGSVNIPSPGQVQLQALVTVGHSVIQFCIHPFHFLITLGIIKGLHLQRNIILLKLGLRSVAISRM